MKHRIKTLFIGFINLFSVVLAFGQTDTYIEYNIAADGTISKNHPPLWLTANQYGMRDASANSAYLRAGIKGILELPRNWNITAELNLAGGVKTYSKIWIQQCYADISWRMLNLSIGMKERNGFPLNKNTLLTSGWMMEGINTRPIPQIRAEINEFYNIPWFNDWFALKGHLAYGKFIDNNWQKDFTAVNHFFVQDVLYHSKSILFRLGKKEKFPLEFEFGLEMATQFGGKQFSKQEDGSNKLEMEMPTNMKAYWSAFFPSKGGSETIRGEQTNVEGNMLGSWNFAFNYYLDKCKIRIYYDHYFDDHSQMFWEYGRWKDGQLGIEIKLPDNKWLSNILWEGMSTYDQTGAVYYDDFDGTKPGTQTSGADDYYNHVIYGAWQHYGMSMGNPLIPGPIYNEDGSILFKSNRIKANHIGLSGNPSKEWNWRVLASYAKHWGTYETPLDKKRKQYSGLIEIGYQPKWAKGWNLKFNLAMDRGNYLGNSMGCGFTICKKGGVKL